MMTVEGTSETNILLRENFFFRYCDMVDSLSAGEGTLEQLSEAKLLKMSEIVDKTSDNIASLKLEGEEEGSPDYGLIKTLKSRIQTSAKNYFLRSSQDIKKWGDYHVAEFLEIKICIFHEIKITIMRSK
jgi:hypothetical protein